MAKAKDDRISSYLAQFRTHLAGTQDHLNGRELTPLPPSFISPTGFWTALEKDAFFHALSVHSRLRPDLIAASVPSKSTLEVCAYIDILEQASYQNTIPVSSLFREMDAAREMSDSWIAWEEENAANLTLLEPVWEREAKKRACEQTNISHSSQADNAAVNTEFMDRETMLHSLRPIHLAVLETMLKVDEEAVIHPQDLDYITTSPTAKANNNATSGFNGGNAAGTGSSPPQAPENANGPVNNANSHESNSVSLTPVQGAGEESGYFSHTKNEGPKRSRIRRNFETAAINSAFLNNSGLGLFRLDSLGRLLKYEGVKGASISVDTIRVLGLIVSEFICRVIHHAIISREQERKAKADTKAWGHSKSIGAMQIKAALRSIGLGVVDSEDVLEDFTTHDNLEESIVMESMDSFAGVINHGESSYQDTSSDVGSQREWHPPYISLSHMPMSSGTFTYLPDDPSTSTDDGEDDDGAQSEIGQEEISDENTDREDIARDLTYEDYLWSAVPHHVTTARSTNSHIS